MPAILVRRFWVHPVMRFRRRRRPKPQIARICSLRRQVDGARAGVPRSRLDETWIPANRMRFRWLGAATRNRLLGRSSIYKIKKSRITENQAHRGRAQSAGFCGSDTLSPGAEPAASGWHHYCCASTASWKRCSPLSRGGRAK